MKIKIVARPKDLPGNNHPFFLVNKLARFFLLFLRKYFGTDIYIEMPSSLHDEKRSILSSISSFDQLTRAGIITSWEKPRRLVDEPMIMEFHTTKNRLNGTIGCYSGTDFFSETRAAAKSMTRAVESYHYLNSAFLKDRRLIVSPPEKLGERAINITNFAGYSQSDPGITGISKNSVFGWVTAKSLISDKEILCPAQLISPSYHRKFVKTIGNPNKREPALRSIDDAVISSGQSQEEALVKGILKAIKCDALMTTYANKLSPPIIDLESLSQQDDELKEVLDRFKRYNLKVFLLDIPTDFPIHVTMAAVIDRTGIGPSFTAGACAGFTLKNCILTALSECLSLRLMSRRMMIEKTRFNASLTTGAANRLIYWSKQKNLSKIQFLLEGERIKFNLAENADFYGISSDISYYKKKLGLLLMEMQKQGLEACFLPLSPSKNKGTSLKSVAIIIPELQPLHNDESMSYSGKRLIEIPKKLGYATSQFPNNAPHPFINH